jgi:hypothetical protein
MFNEKKKINQRYSHAAVCLKLRIQKDLMTPQRRRERRERKENK